ncbi:GNAT family N-acetyltransferase [Planococcus sp. CAU13]|uniref:GNAT family N-acetyltransferase n=1 Tax=Planococcus sp. CAU13 TaxID=1541197 RepID=UPI0006904748|nr:GNAT family N-acetyltransferase [Planococcus sp. CAU13]
MKIESERLLFRRYSDADFPFLQKMTADPEMMKYIGNGQTRDKDGALRFLYWVYQGYKENQETGLLLLERKSDRQPVGQAGIIPQKVDGKDEWEIGYWIANEHWSSGYATEAARTLRDYAFEKLGKERLVSLIHPDNTASQRVAEKCGMKLEKQSLVAGRAVCVYAIQKEEQI